MNRSVLLAIIAMIMLVTAVVNVLGTMAINRAERLLAVQKAYNEGYEQGYDTGALCGSKLGYDGCKELYDFTEEG